MAKATYKTTGKIPMSKGDSAGLPVNVKKKQAALKKQKKQSAAKQFQKPNGSTYR